MDELQHIFLGLLTRNRYDGPVTVSCNWKALDAKRDKFRDSEEKMLLLLKRDYGLTDVEGKKILITFEES